MRVRRQGAFHMIKRLALAILLAGFATQSFSQEPPPVFVFPQEKAVPVAPRQVAKPQPVRVAAPAPALPAQDVATVKTEGNIGELRSTTMVSTGFMRPMETELLPETRALDEVLGEREKVRKFKPKPEQMPVVVAFSGYEPGTIVIDPQARVLYLVEDRRSARRYAIAVGKDGLEFKGTARVGDKQEWPRWFPTKAMQEREPKKYGQYKDGMNGGPDNPLGARAIYLHQDKVDTHVRIHGTNQPETIGSASSNGCFRMINEHVMDLYSRVRVGAEVVVL